MEAMSRMDPCPDLILLDLGLPTIDGYEVLRLLKGNTETREIPVLIVSGRPLADGVELSGVVGVLRKPYDLPLLADALHRAAADHKRR
ncbi:MAG TPA: response regulator [Thermoanaerobaculia bacterium]|nr:response regulator [Thermoanaerobaculia bacterium]